VPTVVNSHPSADASASAGTTTGGGGGGGGGGGLDHSLNFVEGAWDCVNFGESAIAEQSSGDGSSDGISENSSTQFPPGTP
jgi:hypothetical protein